MTLRLAPSILACALGAVLALGADARKAQAADSDDAPTLHRLEREDRGLALWERRAHGEPRGAILLIHGGTWSALPNFDLALEGRSVLRAFAAAGYDAFALDLAGFGASDEPTDLAQSRIEAATADVEAAIEHVRATRSVDRVALVGLSWGAQVAGRAATSRPEHVSHVVLAGFLWGGTIDLGLNPPAELVRASARSDATSDFVPGVAPEELIDAFADAALAADPTSPNGPLVDLATRLPLVDPAKLSTPCLVLLGEHEVHPAALPDQLAFLRAVAAESKTLSILGGGGHAIHLEATARWCAAITDFVGG